MRLRRGLAPALLLALCACGARPPAHAPDTAPGRQLAAWLEAFNSGDDALLARHIEAAFLADPKRALRQRLAREAASRFELVRVNESTATRAVAELKAQPSGQRYGVTFEVAPVAPHRVARFFIARLSSEATDAESIGRGRRFVEDLAARDRFSGVVLVARRDAVLFEQAYGDADRERRIRTQIDTRFSTASIGKLFTAVAVLQLVQAGKVRLDAPFGEYLPDFPNRKLAARATIHQLLTHTAGTVDVDWPVTAQDRAQLLRRRTVTDHVRALGTREPAFEPGTGWGYSNFGYIVLGAVIERVSGEDYYGYVARHVFAPANMNHSGFPTVDAPDRGHAVAYTRLAEGWRALTGTSFYRAIPAGGASTTAGDLMRFSAALLDHRLLDAAHVELLTTGKVDLPAGGGRYAYGVLDRRADGEAWFGHNGGAPGMSADLRIHPWSGHVVVVLSNFDPPVADDVAHEFADWLPRS